MSSAAIVAQSTIDLPSHTPLSTYTNRKKTERRGLRENLGRDESGKWAALRLSEKIHSLIYGQGVTNGKSVGCGETSSYPLVHLIDALDSFRRREHAVSHVTHGDNVGRRLGDGDAVRAGLGNQGGSMV